MNDDCNHTWGIDGKVVRCHICGVEGDFNDAMRQAKESFLEDAKDAMIQYLWETSDE
jgi:hypothetical protein